MEREEALKIIEANCRCSDSKLREACAFFIPELKESEDERIRKELIKHFSRILSGEDVEFPPQDDLEKWIAWLEKQGEHAKFCDSIQVGDKVTRNQDGVLVNLSQLERVAKPAEEYNITGIGSKNAQGKLGKMIKNLKSADKVETKFKVGDWVVIDGEVLHIEEVTEDGYFTDEGGLIPFRNEKEVHIWTIQDAKDGDMLSYRNGQWIFIYKEKIDDKSFYYHALYSTVQGLTIANTGFTLLNNAITPATKEQRDLLFQKMHEAGYEWSDKDRKLIKIVK